MRNSTLYACVSMAPPAPSLTTRSSGYDGIEPVKQISADLVTRDKGGKPYTVRYNAVNAMLLNEFLKEHRKTRSSKRLSSGSNSKLKRLLLACRK